MADFDLLSFILILTVALILVLINGFFVAAEFALVSIRPSKVEELLQNNPTSKRIKAMKLAIENQDEVISATQLGITMASLALGFLAGSFIEPVLEELFGEITPLEGLAIGGIIAFALTTYMHVVLGELSPKSVALQYPNETSLWVARPLRWFAILFKPVIWLFNQTGWLILSVFGIKPIIGGHRDIHSEEELKLLISQSSKAGILDERESDILKRTFDLPDTQIRQILTPKFEMASVSVNNTLNDIVDKLIRTGHSRFPVFDERREHIVGFLYAKDLLLTMREMLQKDLKEDVKFDISKMLREVDYVPETMRADILLQKFQEQRRHSAIVVDEFGEVVGLITLEDILELLVGDIQDVFDHEPEEITPIDSINGEVKVSGQTSLDDFNKFFHTRYSSEVSITIGGYILEKLGRLPEKNETIKLNDFFFVIEEITESRIVSLLVHGKLEREKEEESVEKSNNN